MKKSFCTIAFRHSETELLDIITFLAQIGYDGIEIWGNHLTGGLAQVLEVRKKLQKHRLPVSMLSPYFNFTGDRNDWLASISTAKKFIQYASVLKSPYIRVFTGFKGSREAERQDWYAAIEGLKIIASLAEERGIGLALETHPGTLVDTVSSTLRLLEEVSMPNLKVNLDIYHFWDEGDDPEEPLEALRPFIGHVHAKNTSLSSKERKDNPHLLLHDKQAAQEFFGIAGLGEGNLDYRPFFKNLLGGGYDEYVSIEWFGDDVRAAARSELAFLKKIEEEIANGGLASDGAVATGAALGEQASGSVSASGDLPAGAGADVKGGSKDKSRSVATSGGAMNSSGAANKNIAGNGVSEGGGDSIDTATQAAALALEDLFANAVKSSSKKPSRRKPSKNQLEIDLGELFKKPSEKKSDDEVSAPTDTA